MVKAKCWNHAYLAPEFVLCSLYRKTLTYWQFDNILNNLTNGDASIFGEDTFLEKVKKILLEKCLTLHEWLFVNSGKLLTVVEDEVQLLKMCDW